MAADEEQEDLLAIDAQHSAISRTLLKQRFLLLILILAIIGLTVLSSFTMLTFYNNLQEWKRNSFVLAFKTRREAYEEMKSSTEVVMVAVKESTFSLVPQLDNSGEVALVDLIIKQQKENRLFIKSVLKGTHKLAVQVRGAKTWYEQYSDKLDRLINSSHLTQRTLKGISKHHEKIYDLPATLNPRHLDMGSF